MSSKTHKPRTTAKTRTATRTLRPVPDQPATATARTDAEDKLWAALHANPNSTAADLSAAAKIGKSTAQKILAKWASDRSATRTPGIADGGRRAADLWAITDADTSAPTATDDAATPTDAAPTDQNAMTDITATDTTSDGSAPTHSDPVDNTRRATPAPQNAAGAADAEPASVVTPERAQDSEAATEAAASETPAPADAETGMPAGQDSPDASTQQAGNGGTNGKPERLVPGALRGMVEDHLRDHPGQQFGPTAIAKALGGKSSGAVSNALDRLVADGVAGENPGQAKAFRARGGRADSSYSTRELNPTRQHRRCGCA